MRSNPRFEPSKAGRSSHPRWHESSGSRHCDGSQRFPVGEEWRAGPKVAASASAASISPVASVQTIWGELADGLVVIDRDRKIVLVNAAACKLAQVDPQGMPLDLAPVIWGKMLDVEGREVPAHSWPWAKAMRGEKTRQQECRLLQANGAWHDVLFSAAPLGRKSGRPLGVVATLTDVTQHKQHALVLRQEAVGRERSRMAKDIHDVFCQQLNAIVLQLQTARQCFAGDYEAALRHLNVAFDVARQSLSEARHSMWTFCHESLGNVDPASTVSEAAKSMVRGTPISLDLSLQQRPRELPAKLPLELLRISQEALSNVVKHAQASRVRVELAYKRGSLQLSVQDDGRGFVRPRMISEQSGLGLTSMRERAERLGGHITIDSRPGHGTRVAALIPLPAGNSA